MNVTKKQFTADLGKVQWALYGYQNQHGQVVSRKPKTHTVRGQLFVETDLHLSGTMTMLEFAQKFGHLDFWTHRLKLIFASNHCLVLFGERAKTLWREYNRRQYSYKKK